MSDVLRAWRESAPYWEKHREAIEAMFAPMSQVDRRLKERRSASAV